MKSDVIVVGGGLGGLTCARDLARAGTDVIVVEARSRVGGRVEGMKFDDGRVLQMGGEIVGTVHHGYLELAAELGLTIVPSYTDEPGMYGYDMLEGAHLGEDWLTEADLASFSRLDEELLKIAATVDPSDPWSHPDAARLDRLSVGALVRSLDPTWMAYRLFEAGALSAAHGTLERGSVLAWARAAAGVGGVLNTDHSQWENLKVQGGSSVLVDTLEAELAGRIRFNAPVASIHVGAPCTVTLISGEILQADAVVCALPVGPLRRVGITGLSTARLQSLHRQRQVLASKAVTVFDEPVWRRVGWNGLAVSEHQIGGFWIQGESALSSLLGPEKRGYIDAAPPGTLTQNLLDSLERLCGGPVDAKAVLWRHWGTDPYTLGYVALWEPGDLTAVGPLQGTHEPPFYVAGSDHWSAGYMEGAVRTGRDAARAILGQPRPSLYVES
ncbi:MAG: NAD(P)/FAD-dependent oxidoreductase [Actinobacteria bacterium]|nr:NAD(P)/FAD-dependent oxidoreductase [Actinomycetota bacterium]